jgi:hypothetical protein
LLPDLFLSGVALELSLMETGSQLAEIETKVESIIPALILNVFLYYQVKIEV